VRDLEPPVGVSFSRANGRREILRKLDAFSREVEEAPVTTSRDAFYEQAYRLLASPEARTAFDLSREKTGASASATAAAAWERVCLLARRLIEAGSRFVTVVDTGWDTHQQVARELPDSRFPRQWQTALTGSGLFVPCHRSPRTRSARFHTRRFDG